MTAAFTAWVGGIAWLATERLPGRLGLVMAMTLTVASTIAFVFAVRQMAEPADDSASDRC